MDDVEVQKKLYFKLKTRNDMVPNSTKNRNEMNVVCDQIFLSDSSWLSYEPKQKHLSPASKPEITVVPFARDQQFFIFLLSIATMTTLMQRHCSLYHRPYLLFVVSFEFVEEW